MKSSDLTTSAMRYPEPTPFVASMKEYLLTSQEVWQLEDRSEALKLDWNEGTIAHSIAVQAISQFLTSVGAVNWYPDVTCRIVVEPLSRLLGVGADQLLVFPGSDVALDALVRTFVAAGDHAILVAPTYDNFRIYVESCGARVSQIALDNPLSFNVAELVERVQAHAAIPKIIYLVNPNNPIGYLVSHAEIEYLLQAFPQTVLVIDEAYAEFAGCSSVDLVSSYSNLFVARSFSKAFSLAGLRLGYLVSQPSNLRHVNKVRNPKNISMVAQVGAAAMLERFDLVQAYVNEVVEARAWFLKRMQALGVEILDSHANFVLMRVPDPEGVLAGLAQERIYARDRSYMVGLEGMIRITIGTQAQMERVAAAIERIPAVQWRF